MIFKTLSCLLAGNTAVNLMVTGTEDKMTVTVIPKPAKTGEGNEALSQPLVLTGSANELDAEFATLLGRFDNSRKSLIEQFEATEAVLEAAKKASAEKAAKGVTKAAAKASTKAATAAAPEPNGKGDGEGNMDGEDEDIPGNASQASPPPAGATEPPANLFA